MSNNPYQQNSWQTPQHRYQPQGGYGPSTPQVPSPQIPYFPPPPGSAGVPPPPPPPPVYPSQNVAQPGSGPPLPPRPMWGASRLAVHSNLNFPPPPPSPNRPPALPPRPQANYQPTASQPVYNQPGYSQPSQPYNPQYGQSVHSQPPIVQTGGQPPYAPPAYSQPLPYYQPPAYPPHTPVQAQPLPEKSSPVAHYPLTGQPSNTAVSSVPGPPPPPADTAVPTPTTCGPIPSIATSLGTTADLQTYGQAPQPPQYGYAPPLAQTSVRQPLVQAYTTSDPPAPSVWVPPAPPVMNTAPPQTTSHTAETNVTSAGAANTQMAIPAPSQVLPTASAVSTDVPPVVSSSMADSRPHGEIPTQSGPIDNLGKQLQSVQLSSPQENQYLSNSVPTSHALPLPTVLLDGHHNAVTPPASSAPAIPDGPVVSSGFEKHTPSNLQADSVAQPVPFPLQFSPAVNTGKLSIPTETPEITLPKQPDTSAQASPFHHGPSGIRTVRACVRDDKVLPGLTMWYAHASAPHFTICSRCYADHVWPTVFRSAFPEIPAEEDGKETRRCRFSDPRIQELLFPAAVASGNLQPVFDYVSRRLGIPDCKGVGGADGRQGIKWFRPRDNAVPNMVVCEACYEERILAIPTLAAHFEPATGQPQWETWACDLALSAISRSYKECGPSGDWPKFVAAARARLNIVPCGRDNPNRTQLTGWHTPVVGPYDLILCDACYHDHIVGGGPEQEGRWVRNDHKAVAADPEHFVCCAGDRSFLVLLGAANETKDWTRFWRAVEKRRQLPACSAEGTKGTSWYTFASQPSEFGICGACYTYMIEPTELGAWFVPRQPPVAPETPLLCSLHERTLRVQNHIFFIVQGWFTGDCAAWEQYAGKYAAVRHCSRDEDVKGAMWFGWPECTICHECYVDVVRGTALDNPDTMPLRGVERQESTLCHMYSPRMRALYRDACARTPADPADLLSAAIERAAVYWNTIPICRQMVQQAQLNAQMARMQGIVGSFYKNMGGMQAAVMPSPYRYSQAVVGHGFENQWQLEGARWDKEAAATASLVRSNPSMAVGQLEQRWRAVE